MKALYHSLRRALLGCPSRLDIMPERLVRASESQAAGRLGKGAGDEVKTFVVLTTCGEVCRESCPCFQALWRELTTANRNIERQELLATTHSETDLRDCDRHPAKVDDLDGKAVAAVRMEPGLRCDAQPHTVTAERTPEVDETEHRSEHGDAQGKGGLIVGRHAAQPSTATGGGQTERSAP